MCLFHSGGALRTGLRGTQLLHQSEPTTNPAIPQLQCPVRRSRALWRRPVADAGLHPVARTLVARAQHLTVPFRRLEGSGMRFADTTVRSPSAHVPYLHGGQSIFSNSYPLYHTLNFWILQDCLDLLNECVDDQRLPEGMTAALLCKRFASENSPCVPLGMFMQPSLQWASEAVDSQVTAPCRGDPCNESEVCLVNRNCPIGRSCQQHTCAKGFFVFL